MRSDDDKKYMRYQEWNLPCAYGNGLRRRGSF